MSLPESRALPGVAGGGDELDELVERAREGDEAAFEEILERFESRALAMAHQMGASRADAEDIAQEAFIKLFRRMGSYRGGSRFKAWFYRIVMNTARDHLRRASRPEQGLAEGREPLDLPGTADPESYHRLRQALLLLSAREREVVILRDLQGLGTWEVARALRLDPVTVRRHAMRARAHLREILGLQDQR